MSQTRLRAEILGADGSQYAHLYEKLILGAANAVIDIVNTMDTRDPLFSAYVHLIQHRVNAFFYPFENNQAALHAYPTGAELNEAFERKFKVKHKDKFEQPNNINSDSFISLGLRHTISEISKRCPGFFERVIVMANECMFEEVVRLQDTFDELVIVSGANRFTALCDQKLSLHKLTNSFFWDLETIAREFAKRLPNKSVKLCLITLPDALEKTKKPEWAIGDNFNACLKGLKLRYNVYDAKMKQDFAYPPLLHLISNYLLHAYPHAAYTLCLRNDRINLIQGLIDFYQTHPDLLASNVDLEITQYANESYSSTTITGNGAPDARYMENVMVMMQMACEAEMAAKGSVQTLFSDKPVNVCKYLDVAKFKEHLAMQRGPRPI